MISSGAENGRTAPHRSLHMSLQKAVALLHDTEQVARTFQRTHRWRAAGKVCEILLLSREV